MKKVYSVCVLSFLMTVATAYAAPPQLKFENKIKTPEISSSGDVNAKSFSPMINVYVTGGNVVNRTRNAQCTLSVFPESSVQTNGMEPCSFLPGVANITIEEFTSPCWNFAIPLTPIEMIDNKTTKVVAKIDSITFQPAAVNNVCTTKGLAVIKFEVSHE